MKLSTDIQAFTAAIGYAFRAPELLVQALTHASMSSPTRADNQRLEFLGDRVLGLVIAAWLFDFYPNAAEGEMAKRHAALVNRDAVVEFGGDRRATGECRATGASKHV